MYKAELAKEVNDFLKQDEPEPEAPVASAPAPEAAPAPKPVPKAVPKARPARPASGRKPGSLLGATRKSGGRPGLGARKIAAKVDEDLFSQKPVEAPVVVVPTPAPAKPHCTSYLGLGIQLVYWDMG